MKKHVDLVLIGGDFQAIRQPSDLTSMAVPPKYRQLGDFSQYYSGEKKAPFLTIFIGGNHESGNYLQELYYGGWVAPNIYYLGASGSVIYKNTLRISGISGIYNQPHYMSPRKEKIPLNNPSQVRSVYHIREHDVKKLEMLAKVKVDIMMSHDWPQGIVHHGNLKTLLKKKPFFATDIKTGKLGSPPAMDLLRKVKPTQWLSAHLHVKFQAVYNHGSEDNLNCGHHSTTNNDEIILDMDEIGQNIEKNNSKPIINSDEIAIDLDDIATTKDVAANDDEIALDMENEMEEEISSKNHIQFPTSRNDEPQLNKDSSIKANIYEETTSKDLKNYDEIDLDTTSEIEENVLANSLDRVKSGSDIEHLKTNFLALDKCLPRREYLEILTVRTEEKIPSNSPQMKQKKRRSSSSSSSSSTASLNRVIDYSGDLQYDPEWLIITRAMNRYYPFPNVVEPASSQELLDSFEESRQWIADNIKDFTIPSNFKPLLVKTSLDSKQENGRKSNNKVSEFCRNNQTEDFCNLLGIENMVLKQQGIKQEESHQFLVIQTVKSQKSNKKNSTINQKKKKKKQSSPEVSKNKLVENKPSNINDTATEAPVYAANSSDSD